MATKKEIENAILQLNHNTTAIRDNLIQQTVEHKDMLDELKRTNNQWFKITTLMIIGIFLLVGIKLGGLI